MIVVRYATLVALVLWLGAMINARVGNLFPVVTFDQFTQLSRGFGPNTNKIYTVQPLSQDPKETGAAAKLIFAAALFQKAAASTPTSASGIEGVAIIFDAADGGIVAATLTNVQHLANGSLARESFWKQCYVEPPDAFQPPTKP
jgi:hypothetical protein